MHRADGGFGTVLQPPDHLLDLVGRGLGAAGQGTHLIGDHGEAAAHVAGTGRLDSGVEGQQIGLFGNAADHRQHLIDGGHLLRQIGHRAGGLADVARHPLDMPDRLADHLTRLERLAAGALGGLRRIAGVARDLLHGEPHFVHGGRHHVGHLMLPPGTHRGVVHHPRHLADRTAQLFAGLEHIADKAAQAADEPIEATRQVAEFVGPVFVQATGEIATATTDFHQRRRDLANRPHKPARQQDDHAEKEQTDSRTDQAGRPERTTRLGKDFRLGHLGDQRPAEPIQRLRHGQKRFSSTLETHHLSGLGFQLPRSLRAGQLGQRGAAVVLAARMDFHLAIAADQIDLAALAKAEVGDQCGHGAQAVTQPAG